MKNISGLITFSKSEEDTETFCIGNNLVKSVVMRSYCNMKMHWSVIKYDTVYLCYGYVHLDAFARVSVLMFDRYLKALTCMYPKCLGFYIFIV